MKYNDKLWQTLIHERTDCKQCEFKATRQETLTLHIQTVHKGIWYKCNQCKYKGAKQSSLNTHIETVHNGTRYTCNKCQFTAANKENIAKHQIINH